MNLPKKILDVEEEVKKLKFLIEESVQLRKRLDLKNLN